MATLIRVPNYRESNYPPVTSVRGVVAQFHARSLIELAYPSIHPSIQPGGTLHAFRALGQTLVGAVSSRLFANANRNQHTRTLRAEPPLSIRNARDDTNFIRLIPKMPLTAIITFSRAITNYARSKTRGDTRRRRKRLPVHLTFRCNRAISLVPDLRIFVRARAGASGGKK